jgi:hypothetical protein
MKTLAPDPVEPLSIRTRVPPDLFPRLEPAAPIVRLVESCRRVGMVIFDDDRFAHLYDSFLGP